MLTLASLLHCFLIYVATINKRLRTETNNTCQ